MLISHDKKFIFIHVFKTGGKSIVAALESFANFRNVLSSQRKVRSHISAFQLVNLIGEDKFNSYFSFAFVRNSWDWMVSVYYSGFGSSNSRYVSFSDFVKQCYKNESLLPDTCSMRFQKDRIYAPNGKLLVNFVGNFSYFEKDFEQICSRIDVSVKLPQLNTSKHKPYRQEYNAETQEMVRQLFEPDISCFNFQF